jgi:hypothetical protein
MRPFLFPPAADDVAAATATTAEESKEPPRLSGLMPVTATHMEQIFGVCPLTSDTLDRWNRSVAGALALRKGANTSKTSVLVMNAAQRQLLVTKGAVPLGLFDPPALTPPPVSVTAAAVDGGHEDGNTSDSSGDLVITEADLVAARAADAADAAAEKAARAEGDATNNAQRASAPLSRWVMLQVVVAIVLAAAVKWFFFGYGDAAKPAHL